MNWFSSKSCEEGVHRFEPRYDKEPSQFRAEGWGFDFETLAEKYRRKTYVRDVCVRCGKTIEREFGAVEEPKARLEVV